MKLYVENFYDDTDYVDKNEFMLDCQQMADKLFEFMNKWEDYLIDINADETLEKLLHLINPMYWD